MAKQRLDPGPFVLPMPLALVGAMVRGRPNFMPAAFLGIVNFKPPIVACGLNPDHHTCAGIREHGTFSLSLPSPDQVELVDFCGLKRGVDFDKSKLFETFVGELPGAPMVASCKLSCECRVIDTVEYAVDTVYLAEVVAVYAEDEVLKDGQPEWTRLDPLLFTFPDRGYWKLGDFVARAWSVGRKRA